MIEHVGDPRLDRNYNRTAWLILLTAFALFLLILTAACYGAFQLRALAISQPEQPAVLVTDIRGVDIYRSGFAQPEQPIAPQTTLYEGDSVVVAKSVQPGIVATITLFDGSTVELWAGTELTLKKVQMTRFSNYDRQITFELESGMAQFDLAPRSWRGYDNVQYVLHIKRLGYNLEQAILQPDGTYRARIISPDAPTTSMIEQVRLVDDSETEYVVLDGAIELDFDNDTTILRSGEKLRAIDGHLSMPIDARWQFIRDGDFEQFTQEQYNNTAIDPTLQSTASSTTWFVSGEFYGPNAIPDGYFSIISGCLERTDGIGPGECVQPVSRVAQFRRSAPPAHTTSFKTVITQTIDVDLTPFEDILLEFDGRIVNQSINRAGIIGEECTLGVEVRFINIDNNPGSHTFCFYARDDDSVDQEGQPNGTISNKPYITSIKLEMGRWEHQVLDLKTMIPQMKKVTDLAFYGNGHDYQSEVTNIRLVGR